MEHLGRPALADVEIVRELNIRAIGLTDLHMVKANEAEV